MQRNVRELNKTFLIIMVVILTTVLLIGNEMESFAFETFTGTSPYKGVGYSKYYHNKDQFEGCSIMNGVDVSEYQCAPKCNYQAAKKAGVDFAIIRVCWTGYRQDKHSYKNPDKYWKEHFKKAREAGIKTGIYCFSQARTKTEARREANYICDLFEEGIYELYGSQDAKEYLELPIYMDYEFAGGSSGRLDGIKKTTATNCAIEFCETIKSRGYTPGIYANLRFLDNTIDAATLGEEYDIWAAQYWKKNEFEGKYSKWQYSSSAKINGIKNSKGEKCSVDVNYWYVKEKEELSETSANQTKERFKTTPTKLVKLTAGKKCFKARWKRITKSKADGYVIQYSRYRDMSNYIKKKITSNKVYSKTFKTNFRKHRYYVRIRTYKKVEGKTYYSNWSSKSKVYVK